MKTIIAGSRRCTDYKELLKAIQKAWVPTSVVSGTARGADRLGEKWAKKNNVTIHRFPAHWEDFGRGAGYIRNNEMSDNAEGLIALWDGKSKGTKHMIDIANKKGLKVYVHLIKKKDRYIR